MPVRAQDESARDSLKTYDLSEIVIGGQARKDDRPERLYRVDLATLSRLDAPDVAGAVRMLPATTVQTNSRGETLIYIRSAGERQVAVFLDGAPLNVAWDNRVDLSLVPVGVLGGMTVERGAVGPAYGTNTSGGAVNLQGRRLAVDGSVLEATVQSASAGGRQFRGLMARRRGASSLLAGWTIGQSAGLKLPGEATLPFEDDRVLRLNTDRQDANLYVRLEREMDRGRLGLTLIQARAEKGVAPEGHLDPSIDQVRYWRYPLWRYSLAILNGIREKGPTRWSGSVWMTAFRQDIDSYHDASYEDLVETQEDRDQGAGFRLIGERAIAGVRLRAISFASAAQHRQQEFVPGSVPDERIRSGGMEQYRHVLHTTGLEVTSGLTYPGHWVVGLALDGMMTPDTGVFPETGGFRALSVNAEWHRKRSSGSTWKVNAGSKPRFPTMRELFGTALDRFEVNPDLAPERTWMVEGGWNRASARWNTDAMVFWQRTMDTIDQVNVDVDGVRKRSRVNLDGSRVVGLEGALVGDLSTWWRLTGHATWMRPVALVDGEERHLTEKPEVLATVSSRIEPRRGLVVDADLIYTGAAYGLAQDNSQVRLPTTWRINLRVAAQRFFSASGLFAQVYAGVNNLTDELHLSQLGLPEAGRTWRFGLSVSR